MDSNALKNEFLVESFENLASISEDLTQLEKDPDNMDLLNKLYRTVHTMKGSASFLGYKKLQDITHSAENLLDELREGKFKTNSEIVDTLFETFDICNLILKSLEASDSEGDSDVEQNKLKLENLLENNGEVQQKENVSASEKVEVAPPINNEGLEDSELTDLISGHRDGPEDTDIEKEIASINQEHESIEAGVSSAALASLNELIGEGKMDASVLEQLQGDAPDEESSTEVAEEKLVVKEETSSSNTSQEVVTPEKTAEPTPEVQVTKDPVTEDNRKSIADSFVRVNVKVLDKIMNVVGELVLNRNQIVQYSNINGDAEFSRLSQQLNIITSELQGEVMSTRMQPIGSILTKFERLVRDFSRGNDKKIELKLSGQETELDKTLIEAIKDPLVHIIRNACDHGMETIEERSQTAKSETGTIHIKAYNESGQVTIEIVDDGRGLNRDKIGAKAIEKGVISSEKFEKMSNNQVYNLIFAPGFSTAEKITNISGRGVGMDVVKTNIEKIGGSVNVTSELGVGTTFKLRIPLTLAIVPALIIKSWGESFAIPQLNLVELVRLETEEEKSQIEKIQGSEFLKLRGDLTPLFRLNEVLALENVNDKSEKLKSVITRSTNSKNQLKQDEKALSATDESYAYNIAILNTENHYFGVLVDEILDTEEIVVKPLNGGLKHLSLFGGATIMGDGTVALILDAMGILNKVSTVGIKNLEKELNSEDIIDIYDGSEVQENLLFKLYDGREYAVPLSLVSRLEEFNVKSIELTGKQPIVRYLDSPMPLINLEKTLSLDGISSLENYKEQGIQALNCIVTTIQGKNFGIIVNEILDISIDRVTIDDTAIDREGILGTVFIDDRIISLIDIYSVIEAQNLGGVKKKKVADKEKEQNSKKRVLLVEDSPMYRKLESDMLIELGYDVDIANHGGEGFEKVKENNYDLVLTDIEMPFLTGYELASKIRNELGKADLKIIALSTRHSKEDIEKGQEAGFNYHLEKFKKKEVEELVLNVMKEV